MKNIKLAIYVFCISLLVMIFGCGGSSSTDSPTVSSVVVTTASGESLTLGADDASQNIDVDPTEPITITFSTTMNETTVSDNVEISCTLPEGSSMEQPSFTGAGSDDTFTLTMNDADTVGYKYQLFTCTLTIGEDVAAAQVVDVGKTMLGSSATYEFTNGCAVDDDFNVNSSECWTVEDGGEFATWAELLDPTTGILSFGSLDFDGTNMPSDGPGTSISKEVTLDSDGYSLLIRMSYTSAGDGPGVSYTVASPSSGKYISVGMMVNDDENDLYCGAMYSPDGTFANMNYARASCSENTFYYLRLTVEGSTVTAEYSTDGTTYSEITTAVLGTWPPEDFSSDDLSLLGLSFSGSDEQVGTTATISSTTTTGITSTTQY